MTTMPYEIIKRVMDIFMALILGILFFPICVVAAIAIKIESPNGPIFADTPKRLGKNFKPFYPYKFRSMIPNAHYLIRTDPKLKQLFEEYKKNSYKLKEDPRWTKVGKFIRKYSIDEMPQLINVMRGEMSIVGPRPYYPDELELQEKQYPYTRESIRTALSVKPGITGQWQVNGRSNINFDKRIEMDAQYAQEMTLPCLQALWYDLKILFKTPFAMISGKGAV